MKIKDLNAGDWVQFIGTNGQSQYGKFTKRCRNLGTNEDFTDLIMHNGKTYRLTDNDDFAVVELPFSQKLDESIEVDMINQPPHYTYGNIEIIDMIEQVTAQYPPELAFAIGSAIKYIARANHKNGKEDIDKAKWYLQRVFDKWDENNVQQS
ncbi:DUF3310 domain-containing protein [Staphylococcus pasteuri]|uniref:DUF3310 domain-containing protein n=1 Tax=Staphylococcus pasteuri TaxID=45972 RepID=UPI00249B114C|nr:DUF3310 domain-containing protein [Staphylococcus pasteuri]MDI3233336.1 DUF3310 domain-containing protein [Staphylococcus pasteuri]